MKQKEFGIWSVSNYGIECKKAGYYIEADRLLDRRGELPNWLFHMAEKDWSDFGNFVLAFVYALSNHPKVLMAKNQFTEYQLKISIEKTLLQHYSFKNIVHSDGKQSPDMPGYIKFTPT